MNRDQWAREYLAGASTWDIAAAVGVDQSTVRRHLLAAGVRLRARGERPATEGRDGHVRAAWAEHGSVVGVARALGVSETAASNALARLGLRRPAPAPKRRSLTAAEVRSLRRSAERIDRVDGRIAWDTDAARRFRVMAEELHASGVSLREIGRATGTPPLFDRRP